MFSVRSAFFVAALGVSAHTAQAAPVVIDFEGLTDTELVTNQYLVAFGITFDGATALLRGALPVGGSLNELDFPPHSGDAVVFESASGGITVTFATPALSIGGFFTYNAQVTLTAYLGANVVDSVTSLFSDNIGTGVNPPNEFITVSSPGGITSLTIVGDSAGGSFVLDDFSAENVPEPGVTALLCASGVVAAARRRRAVRARDGADSATA